MSHKRVDLIPPVLSQVGRPLSWVHFGDGPDRARVERAAAALPQSVEWELRGQVGNQELLAYYREHDVDLMLSLSRSEGIPVSMMEAQSFGVPLVATGINGVPEIVNDRTGVLLDPDATVEEMAASVGAALDPGRFERADILEFFGTHFDAAVNHNEFADVLIGLGRGEPVAEFSR